MDYRQREQIAQQPPYRKPPTTRADVEVAQRRETTTSGYGVDGDDDRVTRTPTSTRRYNATTQRQTRDDVDLYIHKIPPRRHAALPPPQERQEPQRRQRAQPHRRRVHWLLPTGLGMLGMLGLWVGGSYVVGAIHGKMDDLAYGFPRTFQTDAQVGHGQGASHFIALNYHQHIEVIEIEGGDPTHTKIYIGPLLISDDRSPVTLQFRDVNGDGKPDMVIVISDSKEAVFLNDGKGFRVPQPNEQITP